MAKVDDIKTLIEFQFPFKVEIENSKFDFYKIIIITDKKSGEQISFSLSNTAMKYTKGSEYCLKKAQELQDRINGQKDSRKDNSSTS